MRGNSAGLAVMLTALLAAAIIPAAQGCVFEYTHRRQALEIAGGDYNYGYAGLDWANNFETCRGRKQSPVLLPAASASAILPPRARSTFAYSRIASNNTIKVVNNGHTVQVTMPANLVSDVKIPIYGNRSTASHLSVLSAPNAATFTYVKAAPAQMHFHTRSEHLMDGASYPLELHIVHFIAPSELPYCKRFEASNLAGCPVVLGVMLKETDNSSLANPALEAIWQAMPLNEGVTQNMSSVLNLQALLPKNRAYFTYEGSLTTPPCTEGLLWHVMREPIYITQAQLMKFREALAERTCPDRESGATGGAAAATGRRLAQSGSSPRKEAAFVLPEADKDGCRKLGNGLNFREVQPLNGRQVKRSA